LINQRSKQSHSPNLNIDKIDGEIIGHLLTGKNNKEISTKTKIPLSTIQRRVRNLIASDLITFNSQINYQKFGFKIGMLHIYLRNGNFEAMANRLKDLGGVTSIEVHVGNSDLIANVVYKHSIELLELVAKVKSFDMIDRIVWSEMIYKVDSNRPPLIPGY
jgi:DNA-binding Lrp family transcriptional regulator